MVLLLNPSPAALLHSTLLNVHGQEPEFWSPKCGEKWKERERERGCEKERQREGKEGEMELSVEDGGKDL